MYPKKRVLCRLIKNVFPLSVAPGLTGIVGGRPRVSPVLKPFFFLYPKANLKVDIHVNGEFAETYKGEDLFLHDDLPIGPHSYRLEELAYTRSGDKGDSANIGVIARHPLYYPYLKKVLTASVVEEYFQHLIQKTDSSTPSVSRYELPGIHGLNFVLRDSLGGGGVASLRSDPQGKSYGQMLLDYKVKGLPDLKSLVD
ncbi:hypothetical protein JZ751_006070 [Albula glossodonta]|uniref:AtuA-like ferredoxin-fold domain-containing protein n=1 Tax=Albula glossodonta TaxID=121402 RepID=A0A8T2P191_9TELE|nr:hypothetical protein JZ751_006070 [Albula glossodonta]